MKIFITGGSGFVGIPLIKALQAARHDITALIRTTRKKKILPAGVATINGDPTKTGDWQQEVAKADIIINLSGQNIFTRWTDKSKHLIYDSRIMTTRNIVEAIPPQSAAKTTLINASAAGYYGFCSDEEKFEDAPAGTDFLATTCLDWEKEAEKAQDKGTRVVTTRFGVILGKNGGALAKMLPAFRLGLGGRLGHGQQWFPWLHITDLCRAILFIINQQEISGPVNFSTPYPVRNSELTRILAEILHRPAFLPVPRFLPQLLLGEFASVLFEGNKMMPDRLNKAGFTFNFPQIKNSLRSLLDKNR